MSVTETLASVLQQDVLPEAIFRGRFAVRGPQSSIIYRDEQPALARIQIDPTGFVDLRLPMDGDEKASLAAVGTWNGELDLAALKATYPSTLDGEISVRSIDSASFLDLLPNDVRAWEAKRVAEVINGIAFFLGQVHWHDQRLVISPPIWPSKTNWCVPDSMSRLSPLAYPSAKLPKYFADRWGQKDTEPFLETRSFVDSYGRRATSYGHLIAECTGTQKMSPSFPSTGQLRRTDYAWVRNLGYATMLVRRDHAEVAYAASTIDEPEGAVNGYAVVTSGTTHWQSFVRKDALKLMFAITTRP